MNITVYSSHEKQIINCSENENLLEILRNHNIKVNNNCGAKGRCGKCRVKILSEEYLNREISTSEASHLTPKDIEDGIRLACMIKLNQDLDIELVSEKDDIHVLADSEEFDFKLSTSVKKTYLHMDIPTIEDQRDDVKRIRECIEIKKLYIDLKEMKYINETLQKSGYKVTATTYNNYLLHLESGNTYKEKYGMAIDLGTTTIALYLMDLHKGEIVDIISSVNNQRSYGADVISRINYTMEKKDGLNFINNCIINQINEMVQIITNKNNINKQNIYEMVVVGNTTMIHLLMNIPCENIALAPFIPVITERYECKCRDLGIDLNAILSLPPSISAYVGSDISSGILSSEMTESKKYSILLDIGTNGEIALGNHEKVITCSTAAGPAFEGANIKHGIGGVDGAICKINFNSKVIYETINDKSPCGICGSAVLDIVSEMLKHNIVDETGKMCHKEDVEDEDLRNRLIINNNMKEFLIYEDDDRKITFTQKDLREVQLAKASICAGIIVLMKEANLTYEDIEKVYIGGGFGNYMNVQSAINIGMIPHEFRGKIESIGNCAGRGAMRYLLSKENKEKIINIVDKTEYIELSNSKDFQEYYIDCITLE